MLLFNLKYLSKQPVFWRGALVDCVADRVAERRVEPKHLAAMRLARQPLIDQNPFPGNPAQRVLHEGQRGAKKMPLDLKVLASSVQFADMKPMT